MPALEPDFDKKHAPELQDLRQAIRKMEASVAQLIKKNPKNAKSPRRQLLAQDIELARERLGDLATDYAEQIETAEALVRLELAQQLAERYKRSFPDTLWRLGQRAQAGEARAHAALGLLHRLGIVAARDETKACTHYAAAAQRRHVSALYQTAFCRRAQPDGKPDPEFLQRAAAGGHPAAQEMLGRACLRETRQSACALDWLTRAGKQERASALSLLGFMYATGELVPKDEQRAFGFLSLAAKLGDPAAQNNVGQMYELGRGVASDGKEAFGWYRRAAESGFGLAQVNLARCYIEGRGTEPDPEAATRWLTQAQKGGVKEASVLLNWLASRTQPASR